MIEVKNVQDVTLEKMDKHEMSSNENDNTNAEWYELADEVTTKFKEVLSTKNFNNVDIKVDFIGNSKQKTLIKMRKVPAYFMHKINKPLQAVINEDLFDKLYNDEEGELMISILFEQEIDRIKVDTKNGKITLSALSVHTTPGVLLKHGAEKVCAALELSELIIKQNDEITL